MAPSKTREPQRIAKLLARAGIASRREIERMIAEGRVALNGKTIDTPATLLPSLHGVSVDGVAVKAAAPARLFLYHKPVGELVTERDPRGRRTIYDSLPADLPRLVPVGRLDFNTEGLLLLTTDGGLKRQLELPASGVTRVYRARALGEVSQDQLEALIEGVEIDGIRYGPIDANLERRTGANVWIEVKITEGKNREVRRVLEHLGLQVNRLIRLAYGPFILADLPPGEIGEVRQHDLIAFRRGMGGAEAIAAGALAKEARMGDGPAPRATARPRRDAPATGTRPQGRDDSSPTRPRRPAEGSAPRSTARAGARPARRSDTFDGRADADARRDGAERSARTGARKPAAPRRDARPDDAAPRARRQDGAAPPRDHRGDAKPHRSGKPGAPRRDGRPDDASPHTRRSAKPGARPERDAAPRGTKPQRSAGPGRDSTPRDGKANRDAPARDAAPRDDNSPARNTHRKSGRSRRPGDPRPSRPRP